MAACLLAASVGVAAAQRRTPPAAPSVTVIANGWLLDGSGAPAVAQGWVRIEGDRIAAVGRGRPAPVAGARVIDATGMTILPGLSDAHVHLGPLPRAKWILKLLLAHGVTTIKETGNTLGALTAIGNWAAAERGVPRMHVSGVTLNGSFSERRFLRAGPQTSFLIEENLRFGAEFFKIHNWVSSGAFRQIAERARQADRYLTGHVPVSMTSVAAIDGGMTILEHVRLHAYEVTDNTADVARTPVDLNMLDRTLFWAHFDPSAATARATLDAWAARKERFFVTPTLVMQEATARAYDPRYRSNQDLRLVSRTLLNQWRADPTSWGDLTGPEIEEGMRSAPGMGRFVAAAHARGVRVLAGSDVGMAWVVPGVSLHRELELLVEAGFTPTEAVRAATDYVAQALRRTDRGLIQAGRLADLLVVQGDLASDISAVRRVQHVVLGGEVHSPEALLREAAVLAAADAEGDGSASQHLEP